MINNTVITEKKYCIYGESGWARTNKSIRQ